MNDLGEPSSTRDPRPETRDSYVAACIQLQIGQDRPANLAKCLDWIDRAAAGGADLIVLPELCNLVGPFDSRPAAWDAADPVPGPFADALVDRAVRHRVFLSFNLLVRGERPDTFITTFLVTPSGETISRFSKHVLFAKQADWCTSGDLPPKVVETPLGRVGLYICMDGLIPETTRVLGLLGAQVMINPLNSAGPDEADLHVPARAAEVRAWVLAANKVGPMEAAHASHYAGGSEIVAPDGSIVARASADREEIVYATIRPGVADDKSMGDGDDLVADRRPDTYGLLVEDNNRLPAFRPFDELEKMVQFGLAQTNASTVEPADERAGALDRALGTARRAAGAGAQVVVLPEAFLWAPGDIAADPRSATDLSRLATQRFTWLAEETDTLFAVNLVEDDRDRRFNSVFLIGPKGIVGRYRQTHVRACDRSWAAWGQDYPVFPTRFGRLGLMLGYDGLFPEVARILALQGAEVILYPCTWRVAAEPSLLALERAAENHVAVVAVNRTDSPVNVGSRAMLVPRYPTQPHWKMRFPEILELRHGVEDFGVAAIDVAASTVKLIAYKTDLVADRRPEYYGMLTAERVGAV